MLTKSTNTKAKVLEIMHRDTSFESLEFKKLIASALSIDELEDIRTELQKNRHDQITNIQILSQLIDDIINRDRWTKEKHDECLKQNHDVGDLIAWYSDRKSKKVQTARKELQKRFLFLSENEQLTIMTTMLGGSKTDREWCYNTLRKWWREELKPLLLSLWNENHEERCGWIITKFFALDEIKPIVDELSYESNYYNLCKRLCGETWFHIDTTLLRNCCDDVKFMWIISQSVEGLPLQEAMNLLYTHVATFVRDTRKSKNPYGILERDMSTRWHPECEEFLYVHKLHDVGRILTSMCRMGYVDEVLAFIDKDNTLHDDFISKTENQRIEAADTNRMAEISLTYMELFISQAPTDVSLDLPADASICEDEQTPDDFPPFRDPFGYDIPF